MKKKPVCCLSFFLFFFLKLSSWIHLYEAIFVKSSSWNLVLATLRPLFLLLPLFLPPFFLSPCSASFPPSFQIFRACLRVRANIIRYEPFRPFPSFVEKRVVQHTCKSVYYKQVVKKFNKKSMICLAFKLKAATFASAIERDAVLMQKWLAVNKVGNGPLECICTKYLTLIRLRERERIRPLSGQSEPLEKYFRKNFWKYLVVWNKLLTFASAFGNDGKTKRRVLWKIYR